MAKVADILWAPVFSGKGVAGLIGKVREHKVTLVHSGGPAALFGCTHRLDTPLNRAAA